MKSFKQQHRPKKSSLIIGRKAILDAIGSGKELERIYIQNTAFGPAIEEIRLKAAEHQTPVNKVPVEKLNSFNVDNHEGCVAVIAKIQYQDLQQVISFVVESGNTPLFLMLDGITDIRNIGAIARTALCCGVQSIIIPDKGVGAFTEDAIAASAGALEQIAICRVTSLMKAVDDLHLNGIRVFASEMTAAKNVFDIDLSEPVTLVLGSEEKGIATPLMKTCDEAFKIPMPGNFESLNVSVAAGMMLYEAMKQRIKV